jgi:hypothetical protein
MNRSLGIQLVVYSLLLVGLGFSVQHLAPALARPTLLACLIGGALCLLWGLRAVAGSPGKALPILTLIPVCFVLLSQAVLNWSGSEEITGRRAAAAVMTFLLLMSLGMLMRIAYTGLAACGPGTSPSNAGTAVSETAGNRPA